MTVLRNIVATLVGVVVGIVIAGLLMVCVLEALHTKDGLVTLIVPITALVVGSVSALKVRRALIAGSVGDRQHQDAKVDN